MHAISILIVEDENIVARDVASRVTRQGYTVAGIVASGEDAIRAAEEHRPDLILMDIMLKDGMDGIEAANRIREKFHIPIVYLTAFADERTLQRAKVTEAFGYLLKPFEERELHITIEMALYKHSMERRLQEHERWLETTLRSIGDAVISTDVEGMIRFMNPMASMLTGWTNAEATGRPLEEVFRTSEGGQVLVSKDGRRIPIEHTAAPARSKDGLAMGSVVAFRDVSEQRRLEEQLHQSKKMESIGTLASGIAHDFNNILNGVLGFAHQLQKHASDAERVQRYSQTIERSATRGADLCAQLLSFARMSKRERIPTDLVSVIDEVVLLCSETFPRTVEVQKRVDSTLEPVLGDRGELYQVLLNLAGNARDAIVGRPDGKPGTVRIEAHTVDPRADSEARRSGLQGEHCVELCVSDTGMGIPDDIRDKIFDPFFTTKERGQGTGLGLSVVYNIIRNHHGVVLVDSEVGVGTTFRVFLPSVPGASAATPRPEAIPQIVTGHRELILVVDDDESMLELSREILEDHGYRVLTAKSGSDALKIYREHHATISLVMIDLMMPGLDGAQTYGELRAVDPSVRAFFCTGYMPEGVIRTLPEQSREKILKKPFTPGMLVEMVRSALSQSGG